MVCKFIRGEKITGNGCEGKTEIEDESCSAKSSSDQSGKDQGDRGNASSKSSSTLTLEESMIFSNPDDEKQFDIDMKSDSSSSEFLLTEEQKLLAAKRQEPRKKISTKN